MKYGYARVSTIHQRKDGNSLEDQRNQLQQEGCEIIVEEQFTGARMDRPKFQRLCALLEDNWRPCGYREEHHVFFSAHQRQLSEEYGLKVYLCLRHHREGPMAAHQNQKVRRLLEAQGQQAFEERYGHKKFMEIFGQNYIFEE